MPALMRTRPAQLYIFEVSEGGETFWFFLSTNHTKGGLQRVKKIYIYKSPDGQAPFLDFMATLDEKARKKLEYALMSMIINKGRLTEPLVKHFSIERYRQLYEIREKSRVLLRVIFAFDDSGNIILLHPFVKRNKRDTNYALEASLAMLKVISNRPDAPMEYPFRTESTKNI